MLTLAYFTLATMLAALALLKKRDWCATTIALGLSASMFAAMVDTANPMPFAAAIDAMTCLAMAAIWTAYNSMRAWTIGIIGMGKTGATLAAYVVDPYSIGWTYALFINAAFLAQVVIAGGWADGLGHRLDHLFARIAPVRRSLLRHGPG